MRQARNPTRFQFTAPELAVFVSGITSMGLEILAGRLVAPQFGSSIYTWGSIIGVFLAALSYGYYRGGKQAAAHATRDRMAQVFLLTGAYVAGLMVLGDAFLVGLAGLPLPSRFASLPAIVVLFGPPTYLLGFISPYAAELSTKDGLGAASGHVYALGTVGSIIGAFGTTFVLIPSLGVHQIELVFGLLAVAAAIGLSLPGREQGPIVASLLVALLLVAAAATGAAGVTIQGRVVYETQTPYQQLEVIDVGDTRTLYLDGHRHSAMDLSDPDRHVFEYTRYFHLPFLLDEDIDRVLFVGGGGFTGPKEFVREYDVTVDVVEIDPVVIEVAKRYFGVDETDRLTIYNQDGREFLQETDHTYDLIVLDAYRQDKVPFHLSTVEFMELASDQLTEDGVLYTNLISAPSGPASDFYRAEYKTMSRVFPRVYSFSTAGGPVVQNVEVIATKNASQVTEEQLLRRNEQRDLAVDLEDEIRHYLPPPQTDDVPVLRDDYAPVDRLLDPMVGQRYVLQETNESEDRPGTPATLADGAARAVPQQPLSVVPGVTHFKRARTHTAPVET